MWGASAGLPGAPAAAPPQSPVPAAHTARRILLLLCKEAAPPNHGGNGITWLLSAKMSSLLSYLILLACLVARASSFGPSTRTSFANRPHLPHARPGRRVDTAAHASIKQRLTFNSPPPLRNGKDPPKLILISGCPGTGERTLLPRARKRMRGYLTKLFIALTAISFLSRQANLPLACRWRWSREY